jgi:hypothetical protein
MSSLRERVGRSIGGLALLLLVGAGVACSGGESGGSRASAGTVATLEMDAAHPEPFSFLASVRELPGGVLLAADPLSQVVLRVDLNAGSADTLGRVGGGPGEYRQPDQVFPLPEDSTLLVDLGKGRFVVIAPDVSFLDGQSLAVPREDGPPLFILPRAVDERGRLYFTAGSAMGQGPPDSLAVVRYDRATTGMDTVARLWRPEARVQRSGGNVRMTGIMMEARDDWAVGPDGRVAVLRANGYSVDWHLPDGIVATGPQNPFEALPISQADKDAYLEETRSGGLMVMMTSSSSGESSTRMSRGGGAGGMAPAPELTTAVVRGLPPLPARPVPGVPSRGGVGPALAPFGPAPTNGRLRFYGHPERVGGDPPGLTPHWVRQGIRGLGRSSLHRPNG